MDACPHCLKPAPLCVCAGVTPIDNRIALVILQHPQEQDVELGSARLAIRHLVRAELKVGLSWPSLAKVLGHAADPKRWAVLYLGAAKPRDPITLVNRKGEPLADQAEVLEQLEGLIVLDGTWSQAKTLWWRNAWMLKCRRMVINAPHASLYGALRREPHRGSLSSLEAAAFALSRLEGRPEIERAMLSSFRTMLTRYREQRATAKNS